jgi:ABC-type nitrate/sulfonate/bicarbonate transport system ATPase subunit
MDMSCVMVTHSVEEALTMGDQLAIFDAGEGRISELFEGMRGREEETCSDQYYQKLRRIQEILNREMS